MDKPTKDQLKKAMSELEDAKNIVATIMDETRNALDELSEKQQESVKGEALSALADLLEEVDNNLDEMTGTLGDIINEK
jgi:GTP1/Obg family GTP-binding protein